MTIKPIAYIHNDFKEKFGVPRQSSLTNNVSRIVFEKPYRDINALRGLEGFSHIWLIWQFSEIKSSKFRPTVRPPRLGGSTKMGVFATRSPFRPNKLGISSVIVKQILQTSDGPVIEVIGADLMDNTPIFDIKPYLVQFDCHNDATEGFVADNEYKTLNVDIPLEIECLIPKDKIEEVKQILKQDIRPHYQKDKSRIYGMKYANFNIRFTIDESFVHVIEVTKEKLQI